MKKGVIALFIILAVVISVISVVNLVKFKEVPFGDFVGLSPGVSAVNPGTGNLVAYYEFEDDFTDSWRNYDGVGYGLSPYGGVSFTQGKFGKAFKLDGVDDYVSIDNYRLDYTKDFSISVWAKPDTLYMAQWEKNIITDRPGGRPWIDILMTSGAKYGFYVWNNNGGASTIDGGEYARKSEWSHIVAVYESAEAVGVYGGRDISTTLYVDGQKVGTKFTNLISGAGNPLNIGRGVTSSRFFKGAIDEVRIYDKALGLGEVEWLYIGDESDVGSGSGSESDSNLVTIEVFPSEECFNSNGDYICDFPRKFQVDRSDPASSSSGITGAFLWDPSLPDRCTEKSERKWDYNPVGCPCTIDPDYNGDSYKKARIREPVLPVYRTSSFCLGAKNNFDINAQKGKYADCKVDSDHPNNPWHNVGIGTEHEECTHVTQEGVQPGMTCGSDNKCHECEDAPDCEYLYRYVDNKVKTQCLRGEYYGKTKSCHNCISIGEFDDGEFKVGILTRNRPVGLTKEDAAKRLMNDIIFTEPFKYMHSQGKLSFYYASGLDSHFIPHAGEIPEDYYTFESGAQLLSEEVENNIVGYVNDVCPNLDFIIYKDYDLILQKVGGYASFEGEYLILTRRTDGKTTVHEVGHAFCKLEDEYSKSNPTDKINIDNIGVVGDVCEKFNEMGVDHPNCYPVPGGSDDNEFSRSSGIKSVMDSGPKSKNYNKFNVASCAGCLKNMGVETDIKKAVDYCTDTSIVGSNGEYKIYEGIIDQ